jgi:xylulokinase
MVLSLDIGTSSVKAGLFDMEGSLLDRRGSDIALLSSSEHTGYEVDPAQWMAAIKILVPSMLAGRKEKLKSIVISGNGPTLVAVDAKGGVLHPAVLWLDSRGNVEASRLLRGRDLDVDPSFYLAKAYWLSRRLQRLGEGIRFFLPCPEYIAFALTGRAVSVLPSPSFRRLMWNDEAIDRLGMEPEWFPPWVPLGAEVGRADAARSEDLGIDPGVPIRLAGPDFLMSLLGTATLEPGKSCDRSGSSEGINTCSENVCRDPRLISLPHLTEGFTNVSGLVSTSGKALEWFSKVVGNRKGDYRTLYQDMKNTEAGARRLLFLPYLAGERAPLWNPDARGNFVGLTLSHGRKEMARAVAEGIGFAIRQILDVMGENGYRISEMTVAGNLANNPVLNQIKADITGCRMLVPAAADAELVGDACVGLIEEGVFADAREAAAHCVSIQHEYVPNDRSAELYADMYRLYRETYESLEECFSHLAPLRNPEEGKT